MILNILRMTPSMWRLRTSAKWTRAQFLGHRTGLGFLLVIFAGASLNAEPPRSRQTFSPRWIMQSSPNQNPNLQFTPPISDAPTTSLPWSSPSDLANPLGEAASEEAARPLKIRAREAFLDQPSPEELEAANDHGYLPFFMRDQAYEELDSLFTPDPYHNYRSDETALNFMPGDGEQFGWLSYQSAPYVNRGYRSGITSAINIHLLSGPTQVAAPPRLYDFILGYQKRARLNDRLSVDLASSIGVFSDFEDSARDGVRFPSHGVGILHANPSLDWVLGVDYVSRDDIKILPVAGFSWHNPDNAAWRFDMVFPRPRINYTLSDCSRLYLGGVMDGGSWDVEFPDDSNDVLTYRDFRLLFGYEQMEKDGDLVGVEMGYVFGREIEFRQRPDTVDLNDAFVLRFVRRR